LFGRWSAKIIAILVSAGVVAGLAIALTQQSPEITSSISSLSDTVDSESQPGENHRFNIVYVKPVFTETAYQAFGFYDFYYKYSGVNGNVMQDLEWLRPVIYEKPLHDRLIMFFDHIRGLNNNTDVTIITDLDLELYDGKTLLNGNNGSKYDAVILGHQEYVTQKEYDVLKEYVAKGGTLIVLNGNVFYAEVDYDPETNTLQLVKGHDWEFNGNVAKKGVRERWAEETSEWMGSNFLCATCAISFENNPFRYGHEEEQYVTNPDVDIILDYKAVLDDDPGRDITVATYRLDHGDGQVIVMGIYAEYVVKNKDFRDFFDGLLKEYVFES
jgi:hypothetical protein